MKLLTGIKNHISYLNQKHKCISQNIANAPNANYFRHLIKPQNSLISLSVTHPNHINKKDLSVYQTKERVDVNQELMDANKNASLQSHMLIAYKQISKMIGASSIK